MTPPRQETASAPEQIAQVLERIGARRCAGLTELYGLALPEGNAAVTARFVVEQKLRVLEHHDLQPAIMVYDPALSVIGVVETLDLGSDNLVTELTEHIDRAAYLRQLCLIEGERWQKHSLTVELVLVLRGGEQKDAEDRVGTVLRRIARETGYFRVIGVNLLYEQSDGSYRDSDVRRAFCWLLADTRKWLAGARESEPPELSLKMENYRLPGIREYRFTMDAAFHVIHGANGSGKTSLSEALELLATGAVERLVREAVYFPNVRYQPKGTLALAGLSPAGVELAIRSNGASRTARAEVVSQAPEGTRDHRVVWQPETGALPSADSFRLDQVLMDRLVRCDEMARAALFLRAFFPEDRPLFEALSASEQRFQEALKRIPSALAGAGAAGLEEALAWIHMAPPAWPAGILLTIEPCLPARAEQLQILAPLDGSLRRLLERYQKEPGSFQDLAAELRQMDAALKSVKPKLTEAMRHLRTAIGVLEEFAKWRAGRQIDRGHDFAGVLNEWLELQALADLVSKYYEVEATLEQARRSGWKPRPEHAKLLPEVIESRERIEYLRACREDLIRARDEARARVGSWTVGTKTGKHSAEEGERPPRLHLTAAEVESLNGVGSWLESTRDAASRFGDLFVDALRTDQARTVGRAVIGMQNGCANMLEEARDMLALCESLSSPERHFVPAAENLKRCEEALAALEERKRQQQRAAETFLSQIAGDSGEAHQINAALNELLSLFKPAPWAYRDIRLLGRHRGHGGTGEQLSLRTADNARADLRLNTAETNALTLSLFLLCAPRLDNPLRLLVLDDPLQNMDEMTVSALARGLAKLMRIYPKGWQVIALFHGEEDLHRIREEVPSAVYRLPWLSPNPSPRPVIVEEEKAESTCRRARQRLEELVS